MELRVIRYFLAVVDVGSITHAATELHLAQPSLSRQIRRFERQLGFDLFDRSQKAISLTIAGRAFLPIAREFLGKAELAAQGAKDIAAGRSSQLILVAAHSTITDIIGPTIAQNGKNNPISNVIESKPEGVYPTLQIGEADLAVGTLNPPPELSSVVVGHAFLWAQCALEHPFAGALSRDIEEIVKHPLILMSRDHGVRRFFDEAVARRGLTYSTAAEVSNTVVAQSMALAGRGVCVLSDDPLAGLHARPIRNDSVDMIFPLYAVWDDKHFAVKRILETIAAIRETIQNLYPEEYFTF